jgi:hypothetical protein
VIGQVVIVRLAEQYTLGAITAEHSADDVDVHAFALYADGHVGVVELAHVQRGVGVDQWQEPPIWPPEPVPVVASPPPALAAVRTELMPVAQLPSLPRMPLMIIIRH